MTDPRVGYIQINLRVRFSDLKLALRHFVRIESSVEVLCLILRVVQAEFVCRIYTNRLTVRIDHEHDALLSDMDAAVADIDIPLLNLFRNFRHDGCSWNTWS